MTVQRTTTTPGGTSVLTTTVTTTQTQTQTRTQTVTVTGPGTTRTVTTTVTETQTQPGSDLTRPRCHQRALVRPVRDPPVDHGQDDR